MIIKTGLRNAGSFPARTAGYEIFPSRNGRIAACQPYKYPTRDNDLAVGEQVFQADNRQEYLSVRLTMSHLFSAMGADSRGQAVENKAVITSPGLVPAEIERSFSLAGPEFAADFAGLANIVFCPLVLEVDDRGVRWSPGFELGMFYHEPVLQRSFLSQAKYLDDPARIVFVSAFSAEKLPIPGEELHWSLSFLVGRVKINALAVAKGLSDFGESARDCYAQIYQIRLTQNLLEQTLAADPSFNSNSKFMIILKYLIGFDQMVGKAANLMTPAEKQRLAGLFGGESVDTTRRYNQAFVEAMLGTVDKEPTAS
ncbi:MAG: hypothetical protein WCW67_08065 [Candidatus Margulisiibacteriota bacterium]|jgi:hypothetical protein